MKLTVSKVLVLVLAGSEVAVASSWFTKTAYNKWHETELERWLSDHDIPYPTPADRRDLESLVKTNWNNKVAIPAYETTDQASQSYSNIKDWIFDSWTDSQLKSFLDHNGIPTPQPRKRDSLLTTARSNYAAVSKKAGEYASYPGDWLYSQWSESELKEFLDARGYPVPQPSTRDKLIASVRRNSRLATLNASAAASAASASAASAQASLSDALFDAWSDSQLKEWFDTKGIKVPQGSKRNELIALARKNSASLVDSVSSASSTASSAYGAATSKAGNEYAKATEDTQLKGEHTFDSVVGTWSDSRLKAFLDARGVPVPQGGKRDELLAKVRLHKHKAATGYSAWTFDTWTTDNLKAWLSSQNHKAAKKSGASRDELVTAAQSAYSSASKSGGSKYATVTSYLSKATDTVRDSTFDTWSNSELKSYLDSYGVSTYQGSTTNELKAAAKKHATYFKYGTNSPQGSVLARIQEGFYWGIDQVKVGLGLGKSQGQEAADAASEKAKKLKEEL